MSKALPFCIMPWVHFHVSNNGKVKACCVSSITYGNINQTALDDIWQGEAINGVREQFLRNQPDKRCSVCLNRESAGSKSLRNEANEKYGNLFDADVTSPPVYFDIRFSNVCNFRCRTCWHGASSKWFNESVIMGTNIGQTAILKNINDFRQFIDSSGKSLLKAKEIYFAGGEPLVTEEHYLLLDYLISHGARNILLRYNTNLSTLNFKAYDLHYLWSQFKEVNVLASIDATSSLGEYVRKDFCWETFLRNAYTVKAMTNVKFQLSPTVSVFNIRHLPELHQSCIKRGLIDPDDLYINLLDRPHYYNIQALPKKYKALVKSELEAYIESLIAQSCSQTLIRSFQDCIDFMMADDKIGQWDIFLQETAKLDELRKEDINEHVVFE